MNEQSAADAEDPDIVAAILEKVLVFVPEANRPDVVQLEQQIREQFGGLRVRIPKRRKDLRGAAREEVYQDILSDMPTAEILKRRGISRSTLYRLAKKGRNYRGSE